MSQASLRVAHIDDDDDLRAIVRLTLESTPGFTVASCESGQAALDRLPGFHPDVILVDLMMPGMDGLETLHALGQRMDLGQVAVVLATGVEEGAPGDPAQAPGVCAVLHKPFDANTLAQRLRGLRKQ